jgi:hypothetical protein
VIKTLLLPDGKHCSNTKTSAAMHWFFVYEKEMYCRKFQSTDIAQLKDV